MCSGVTLRADAISVTNSIFSGLDRGLDVWIAADHPSTQSPPPLRISHNTFSNCGLAIDLRDCGDQGPIKVAEISSNTISDCEWGFVFIDSGVKALLEDNVFRNIRGTVLISLPD